MASRRKDSIFKHGIHKISTDRQTQHLCGNPAPEVTCDPEYRYRSADGSCNNLKHPHWGRSHTAQERFLLPEYDNGNKVSC